MEKEIKVNDKSFFIKEVKYKNIFQLQGLTPEQSGKKLMQLAVGITDEEYENLSLSEGIKLMEIVNEVNGLSQPTENFQVK